MTIRDDQLLFSDNQAITATANSTNVIDLKAVAPGRLDAGEPMRIDARVTESFATATSVNISVVTADNEALSSGAVTLAQTGATAIATLVAGYEVPLDFLRGNAKRYLGLVYTVAGSNATAGKISAGLVHTKQTNL